MKKFLSILILPLMAVLCLVGCGEAKTAIDIENYYKSIKASFVVEEENICFSNTNNPNTITILYKDSIGVAVNNQAPTTDNQKRFVALGYQQQILDYIFNFYEKNNAKFYKNAQSSEIKDKEYENLYKKLENLEDTLDSFKTQYNLFIEESKASVDDLMAFSIINYTYQVNKVIESSFDFIYEFINLYENHIIDTSKVNAETLSFYVDKAYVDIARIVYLENFQAFNYSVGDKGVCDLLALVDTNSQNLLIDNLTQVKPLSIVVAGNLEVGSVNYEEVIKNVNNFIYAKDVFYQKLQAFNRVINVVDMYTLNQYRFDLVSGVSFENYISTLSISNRANVEMIQTFVEDVFFPFLNKLQLITA